MPAPVLFILSSKVVSFENYLAWLNHTLADYIGQKIHIVDESTAAALGYTVTKPKAPVLVFDFGGGTLDLSLVQLPESRGKTGGMLYRLLKLGGKAKQHTAKVIAKAGQVIGGSDIDQWLLDDLRTKQIIIQDVVIASLHQKHSPKNTFQNSITGHEPHLFDTYTYNKKRSWRLSVDKLGIMLELLPPAAISLEAITAALHHKEFYVRYNAAKILARRGDRNARLVVQETLTNSPPSTRANVARFLYRFSWYTAKPLFQQALKDSDTRVRESAMAGLSDCRLMEAYRLMAESLKNELDDEVHSAAVWSLRAHHNPAAVPVLAATLGANDFQIREHALEVLGQNDLPEAIPVVKQTIITDSQPEVKYAAVWPLAWIAHPQAVAAFKQAYYQETNAEVKAHILHLAFNLLSETAAELLVNALSSSDIPLQTMAMRIKHDLDTGMLVR